MKHELRINVNGHVYRGAVESRTSLLTFIREQCLLTGTKRGCVEGECGGCSVLMDGELVDSCLVFAIEAQDKSVVTIEGLGSPENLSPLQLAFADVGASQCGFCIPGLLLAATALLDQESNPEDETIRSAFAFVAAPLGTCEQTLLADKGK